MRDLVKTLGLQPGCASHSFDKCFSCHGPDEHGRKADLRLDIEKNAKDTDLMAIVAGKPDESEMIFRIHSDDEDEVMPPPEIGKPLTLNEKNLLEQWIREGAVWADHWAYVDPVKNPLPKLKISPGQSIGSIIFSFTL